MSFVLSVDLTEGEADIVFADFEVFGSGFGLGGFLLFLGANSQGTGRGKHGSFGECSDNLTVLIERNLLAGDVKSLGNMHVDEIEAALLFQEAASKQIQLLLDEGSGVATSGSEFLNAIFVRTSLAVVRVALSFLAVLVFTVGGDGDFLVVFFVFFVGLLL